MHWHHPCHQNNQIVLNTQEHQSHWQGSSFVLYVRENNVSSKMWNVNISIKCSLKLHIQKINGSVCYFKWWNNFWRYWKTKITMFYKMYYLNFLPRIHLTSTFPHTVHSQTLPTHIIVCLLLVTYFCIFQSVIQPFF